MLFKRVAFALVCLLGTGLVLSLIALFSDLLEAQLLSRIAEGGNFSDAEIDANDARQRLIGVVQFLLHVVTIIFWLKWFSRAYKNLPNLGAQGLRFPSGWAIGAWFVPFLNLVRPKALTNDIWKASDPALPALPGEEWKTCQVSPLIHWWWALFLISDVVGRLTLRASFGSGSDTLEGIRNANALAILFDVLDIASTVLAILVVRRITGRQMDRAHKLGIVLDPEAGHKNAAKVRKE